MLTITQLDYDTIRLVKAIYDLKELETITQRDFLRVYGQTKRHTAKTEAIELMREFNAIRHYNQFMKETYGRDELNRNYFFNEFVLPVIEEAWEGLDEEKHIVLELNKEKEEAA